MACNKSHQLGTGFEPEYIKIGRYWSILSFSFLFNDAGGTRYRSWLRNYATSRKFAGSIPDEVIEFFSRRNPSSRNMALVSTQSLTEMSTRNFSGDKGRPTRKADNLTTICDPII
jgi:hypothetical protein